jgi:hypothetical protein
MSERKYIAFLAVGMCVWGMFVYLLFAHAPRTNNPTDCQELAQPEQDKCKARRRL